MSGARRCGGRRPAVVGDNTNGYVETDPTGRYGRFEELLGKGAMKCVYRGFDEERGVEVAWNQAILGEVTPDAVQRMHSEVQLLRTLRHDGIIGFQASWVDPPRRTFNFITELFSSGTLRSYRLRYPRVSLRAVRSWARQILRGLAYLHARRPPVIHRDLKCDNLLVNGHQGQVKIADLGLAAVLREAGQAAHSVIGTPEFMAPEMYDEEYDERVDVYAFGMCVLEMLTLEYPYSECSNPAQIYKKVTAGKLPQAFYRVQDAEARRFIGRCLVAASERPSAAELLLDPFLLLDDKGDQHHRHQDDGQQQDADPPPPDMMTITGKLNAEEDTIFLKVQIAGDETGNNVRNIYFPFDMVSDTATEVAEEMVKELEIRDRDPSEIAAMIEQEIQRLLPGRKQQHDEYTADDDDDDENGERPPAPFYEHYLSSSPTSSQGSLGGFSGPQGTNYDGHYYYAACLSDDDDTSMHSSEEAQPPPPPPEVVVVGGPSGGLSKAQPKNTTRFGPGESSSSLDLVARQPHAGRPRRREDDDRHGRKGRMTRNRSMVDMRSQLLHRTLVEELNRRLFFNTVAAVENIGFRVPTSSTTTTTGVTSTSCFK